MLIGRHFGNVWKMLLMVAPLFLLQSAKAQQNTHEVNGKVTFKIETKRLTLQQAQAAKNDKTPISLKVSLIFEGEWVSLFDQKFRAYANSSAFAFGIAKTSGDNLSTSAPLYEVDPPAWIYSAPLLHCTAPDGGFIRSPIFRGSIYRRPELGKTEWRLSYLCLWYRILQYQQYEQQFFLSSHYSRRQRVL